MLSLSWYFVSIPPY